jgi:hypothetical protein
MTTKPVHPVEAFEASVIASATSWTAFQARGPFDRHKFEGLTRAEAEAAAHAMLDERPDRSVLIYAVNAEGRQALADTISRRVRERA